MGKSSHFSGQPLYGQVIKLLDKSKIHQISREKGGERYTKRFNGWIHLVFVARIIQTINRNYEQFIHTARGIAIAVCAMFMLRFV